MVTEDWNKKLKREHGRFLKPQSVKRSNDSLSPDDGSEDHVLSQHLAWTKKQGNILSGGGKAEEYYTPERGFPFQQSELPHHHLIKGKTQEVFETWRSSALPCSLVSGVWNRTVFVGGWQHSTDKDETVYNIQTHNLFIDLRIPKTRNKILLRGNFGALEDLGPQELRLYARQHIFAGFSFFAKENGRPLCTRHHCIDWNFVGTVRSRPNKWWIETHPDGNMWKEHAYATDNHGQHYYFEQWERIGGTSNLPRLALRKASTESRDGILVAIGDHFNYVLERKFVGSEKEYPQETSLVDLVDAAVSAGDLETARSYLSIEGGHGRVSSGWRLDCSISPWDEGTALWMYGGEGDIQVEGDSIDSCYILWKGEKWELYDCNFRNVQDLSYYLGASENGHLSKL
jgi:hypothetical protein